PEPGLQGQVPRAVQGEESRKGFWCGMREVGRSDIGNRGGNYGHAWIGDCAYVTTFQPRPMSEEPPAGLAVIDVADPTQPQLVRTYQTAGSLQAVETITAREAGDRKVLVTGAYDGNVIDIWDASDCRNPRLMKSLEVPYNVHNVTLSWDAKTLYYATALPTSEANQPMPNVVAVDVADLANPKVIHHFALSDLVLQGQAPAPLGVHNVEISPDGTRMYAGIITPGLLAPLLTDYTRGRGEMTILDVSDIQDRKADPEVRFISQFESSWHGPKLFERDGRTYLVSGDEAVNNSEPLTSCGGPFPRIADITDETAPRPIADVPLEINKAEHCPAALEDNLLYSTHYTDVDDQRNATLGLFPMYNAGLRVVDLRDPAKPTEIGYFNPGPDLDTKFGATYGTRTRDAIDLTPSHVRYKADTGHIWFVSITSGFHVVELTQTGRPGDLGLPARATQANRRSARTATPSPASASPRLTVPTPFNFQPPALVCGLPGVPQGSS
ncbi:MAG: LVIVD repeat-containing protein, partial [Solirubrobacteraceae bacterium]